VSDTLRHALAKARLQPVDVAAALGVDPKTVDRWLKGRTPYPRHRWALADLLKVDETELWPEADHPRRAISSEVQAVYPHRWTVPRTVWTRHFQAATREIGILAYSALFLAEDTGIIRLLAERARAGVKVRILLGDPGSPEVAARGIEEGIGPDVMAADQKRPYALSATGRSRRRRDPPPYDHAVQLDLPRRRRPARQRPHLRHTGSAIPGHPATGSRR